MSKAAQRATETLRAYGLEFPGAHIKSPWPNHADLAVREKTFAYLGKGDGPFSISCKLPESSALALELPFTSPTGYGLGKWGWVTATIEKGKIPLPMLKAWIEESYRSQAPKRLVQQLDDES